MKEKLLSFHFSTVWEMARQIREYVKHTRACLSDVALTGNATLGDKPWLLCFPRAMPSEP